MEELNAPDYKYTSEFSKEIDRQCIELCLKAVTNTERDISVSKEFLKEQLPTAFTTVNKSEYILMSHPNNQMLLKDLNSIYDFKFRVVYSPLVDESVFLFTRSDGTCDGSACIFEQNTQGITSQKRLISIPYVYTPKINHPEFITLVTIRELGINDYENVKSSFMQKGK